MARLAIFTSEEQRLFELPPLFNNVDRERLFFLLESLLEETKHFDNFHNKVYFYLMYGYFKATNKFYRRKFHQKDIEFVAAKLGISFNISEMGEYNERTYRDHRDRILAYTGCKKFDQIAAALITTQLNPMIKSHTRPKIMLEQACDILIRHKMGILDYPRKKVKQTFPCKKRKQAERKKQTSFNGFILLLGKTSIYSVDLNFIYSKHNNIDEVISLLGQKIVWQQLKTTDETLG